MPRTVVASHPIELVIKKALETGAFGFERAMHTDLTKRG